MSEVATPPLAGVRVLDLSRVLAGPWCTQCLADLGAEVLKIEAPGDGDETRGWGPPWIGDLSAYFSCANRSKTSLVLDLRTTDGQAAVRALAEQADVLIENYKTGTLERFGLGYAGLRAANPRLIHCSISGYGRTGPNATRAGYDFVIQAETGLMSVTGEPDGAPVKVGVAVSDLFAGLYASQAILAALIDQRATGRGRAIDVALFDCQLAALANIQASALATGRTPGRLGNAHAAIVPYESFEAADGAFVLALGNDRQFAMLCGPVLGEPALAVDPRFATNAARVAHREILRARLDAHFRRLPQAEWLAAFRAHGLPAGRVQTVDEALASEQTVARGLLYRFGDEADGLGVVRYPVRIEGGLPDPTPPPRPDEGGRSLADRWLHG